MSYGIEKCKFFGFMCLGVHEMALSNCSKSNSVVMRAQNCRKEVL